MLMYQHKTMPNKYSHVEKISEVLINNDIVTVLLVYRSLTFYSKVEIGFILLLEFYFNASTFFVK